MLPPARGSERRGAPVTFRSALYIREMTGVQAEFLIRSNTDILRWCRLLFLLAWQVHRITHPKLLTTGVTPERPGREDARWRIDGGRCT
jgi:hypothetical protein